MGATRFTCHPQLTRSARKCSIRRKAGVESSQILRVNSRRYRRSHIASATSSSTELRALDTMLKNTAEEAKAVSLIKQLCESGELVVFGQGRQVPKRSYTLEELRLNKIDTRYFLSPEDTTLDDVRTKMQLAAASGAVAAFVSNTVDTFYVVQSIVIIGFLLTADQIANAGGLEALVIDSVARIISPTYQKRVALHEAGHFLIAYLLGLLPKGYTLSSWDAFLENRKLNFQAGTTFCDSDFQKEVSKGQISSSSLDVFSCVALAGVATEWLRYGKAEGGLSDIMQLDSLMKALGFTQAKADDQVRWSVLNVVTLLRRHSDTQDILAEAMLKKSTISECIQIIENNCKNSL